jgi:hypothetical protein
MNKGLSKIEIGPHTIEFGGKGERWEKSHVG